ncbi:unnamed protein product [Nezara viridula]|uniref:Uncharacterized protein n=1 Tax=Nezara viridula TaxID=85310 RepID=A0A9P0E256_NEZVI|nr:unnamed protein product [Nezara viridula]
MGCNLFPIAGWSRPTHRGASGIGPENLCREGAGDKGAAALTKSTALVRTEQIDKNRSRSSTVRLEPPTQNGQAQRRPSVTRG